MVGSKKRTRLEKYIVFWLPVALWMSIIFILSSREKYTVTPDTIWNFLILKLGHMFEYGVLFFLTFRAIHQDSKLPIRTQLATAAMISVIYSITDEFHQTFVPTRQGTWSDVVIDSVGIVTSIWYVKNHYLKLNKSNLQT